MRGLSPALEDLLSQEREGNKTEQNMQLGQTSLLGVQNYNFNFLKTMCFLCMKHAHILLLVYKLSYCFLLLYAWKLG